MNNTAQRVLLAKREREPWNQLVKRQLLAALYGMGLRKLRQMAIEQKRSTS